MSVHVLNLYMFFHVANLPQEPASRLEMSNKHSTRSLLPVKATGHSSVSPIIWQWGSRRNVFATFALEKKLS